MLSLCYTHVSSLMSLLCQWVTHAHRFDFYFLWFFCENTTKNSCEINTTTLSITIDKKRNSQLNHRVLLYWVSQISPSCWVSLCWISWRRNGDRLVRKYYRGTYYCTIDLMFDWFGISCMTTDNFCVYLQNRPVQTSQTGGQWYSDTSHFSIPWLLVFCWHLIIWYEEKNVWKVEWFLPQIFPRKQSRKISSYQA